MNILISNDDGIFANGIKFLAAELRKEHHVTVIAPNKERSSCGHGITLGEPIRIKKVDENSYECSGYPADCILVGVGHLCQNPLPDLVISGINHGANLGQDRFYSGTVAAAREAAFRGIPSIAVSLVTKSIKDVEHFETASKFVCDIVRKGVVKEIPEMHLLNINVPNLAPEKIAGSKLVFAGYQDYSEEVVERVDTRGRKYFWVGGTYKGAHSIPGSDGNAINEGYIAVNLQNLEGSKVMPSSKMEQIVKKE